ncbi:response regulator transcription factor [Bdellovibrionota bacterium FG-1]
MTKNLIRVLLVDDHPLFREGIKSSLNAHSDIEVVGEASDGLEAIEKTAQLDPNVILLDIGMPKMNGLMTAKVLREKYSKSQILILTMHNRWEYVQRFIEMGVKGYILKDAHPHELSKALRRVSAGQAYVSEGIDGQGQVTTEHTACTGRDTTHLLSKREWEVLKCIAISSRSKDVAEKLGISVRTVEKHRGRIMKKLGIDNVAGLIRYALTLEIDGLGTNL